MGMCPDPVNYLVQIQKEVPGSNGNFVTAMQYPGEFNTQALNLPEIILPLA